MVLSPQQLKDVFPLLADKQVVFVEKLLEKIDCPNDGRGLYFVINLLERLSKTYPSLFFEIFEFHGPEFDVFSDVAEEYKKVSIWKLKRPLYAMLFAVAKINQKSTLMNMPHCQNLNLNQK